MRRTKHLVGPPTRSQWAASLAADLQGRIDLAVAAVRTRSTVEYRWVAQVNARVSRDNYVLGIFPLVVEHHAVAAIHTPVWQIGYGTMLLSPELGTLLIRLDQPRHHVPMTILAPITPMAYVMGLYEFIRYNELHHLNVEDLLDDFVYKYLDELVNGPRQLAEARW